MERLTVGKWQAQLLSDICSMLADGAPQAEDERICREKLMRIVGHASTLTMLAEGALASSLLRVTWPQR